MSDDSAADGAGGLRAALSRLSGAFLDFGRTRIELASVEFAEERERATERLVLLLVAAIGLAFALLAASAFVVVLFWDTHRLVALGTVALGYLAIGGGALLRLRERERNAPKPFATTLAELQRDREWLGERFGR